MMRTFCATVSTSSRVVRQQVHERVLCFKQISMLMLGALFLVSGLSITNVSYADTCMECHNGSDTADYSGPGIENPHPFGAVSNLSCVFCHGGDNTQNDKNQAHVPAPPLLRANDNDPSISAQKLLEDPEAYFNRLTLAGLDKLDDYEFDGQDFTALDYLQFINPGDLRVVTEGRSCGTVGCHNRHSKTVAANPLSSEAGFFSGAKFSAGINSNLISKSTDAEYGFRAIEDDFFFPNLMRSNDPRLTGKVRRLEEVPDFSQFDDPNSHQLFEELDADIMQFFLSTDPKHQNSVLAGTPLDKAWNEMVNITCGDCHAGSAGANNRFGDFRSSGCTSCHMPNSPDGIGRSLDPFVGVGAELNAANEVIEETVEFQHGNLPDNNYNGVNDTFIDQANRTTNFGSENVLLVDGDNDGNGRDYRTLIRFDLSDIPPEAEITDVEFTIDVTNPSGENYFVRRLLRNWNAGQATWFNATNNNEWQSGGADGNNDMDNDVLAVIGADDTGQFSVDFNNDGVDVVQGWVDGSIDNFGFVISNPQAFDGLDFRSRNDGQENLRPKLTVSYRIENAVAPFLGRVANPDQVAAPEIPGVNAHRITSVHKQLADGSQQQGIDDYACAGCHQGSNRTVLQFWGVRLDQNADLTNNVQYPANPEEFQDATNDPRLFSDVSNNNTFNGRNADQLIVFEDYDGDGRDDTPADVHYEAGLGCIDCHGSRDVHGANLAPVSSELPGIASRQSQHTKVQCQSCHGDVSSYAKTVQCVDYENSPSNCAKDKAGLPMRNVTVDNFGNVWLKSRVTGNLHFVPQTRDTVVSNNKVNPLTGETIYNERASFAMGRADGSPDTGIGPVQAVPGKTPDGFSHSDNMDCTSCHASWTNTCKGCHLANEFDDENFFFSNVTGERIVLKQAIADFVYQTPVWLELGVNSNGKISTFGGGMKTFFSYIDADGDQSDIMAFSDRLGNGNNPNVDGRGPHPALGHDQLVAHSIRGRVENDKEGVRGCVACHLTTQGMNNFGDEYREFVDAMKNNDFEDLDFNLLQQHIGQNSGNQLNSPIWVHKVMGLGSGLLLFDEDGCPINPLDNNPDRKGCNERTPAQNFQLLKQGQDIVKYNLDKMVEWSGVSNASCSNPMLSGSDSSLRDGANHADMCGPVGQSILEKMADPDNGLILDAWIDANGNFGGTANQIIQQAIDTRVEPNGTANGTKLPPVTVPKK